MATMLIFEKEVTSHTCGWALGEKIRLRERSIYIAMAYVWDLQNQSKMILGRKRNRHVKKLNYGFKGVNERNKIGE